MLTQAMPSLADSMQGLMPLTGVRNVMQALGNCSQPLSHRGPLSVAAGPVARQSGPGFYSNGYWPPGVVNSVTNVSEIFNNQAFFDTTTNNSYFSGDQFLFNNDSNFITNLFPTTIVMGQPGVPGRDGRDGLSGYNGIDGAPGAAGLLGVPGINGVDGTPGATGGNGADGVAGAVGQAGKNGVDGIAGADGAAGVAGVPGPAGARGPGGRDGRNGLPGIPGFSGGYSLQLAPAVRLSTWKPRDADKKITVQIPKYAFDPDACSLVPDGNQDVEITIPIKEFDELVNVLHGSPTLVPKPLWP